MNTPASSLDTASAIDQKRLKQVVAALPPLPSSLRYYDDFLDKFHTIKNLSQTNKWCVRTDGLSTVLSFSEFNEPIKSLLKHITVDFFSSVDPTTVRVYHSSLRSCLNRAIHLGNFILCLSLQLPALRNHWLERVYPAVGALEATALKAALRSSCGLGLYERHAGDLDIISSLPLPKVDHLRVIRTGDCFVPMDRQSLVIDYFDELTREVAEAPHRVATTRLRDACILLLMYGHALRPGQVARITTSDVRVFNTGAVHYSFPVTKQRDLSKRRGVSRRIKRDWCPLVAEFQRRRGFGAAAREDIPKDSLFELTPGEVGRRAQALMEAITGENWSATDLRHSAAQRLVDAGVSQMALTEFMTHSATSSARVYFDTSPTQAERVNQALGLSPIYSNVAEVARTRTIDKAALLAMPPERHIGAVPHGIPIAGIGACSIGQPVCDKNPVLSCYTCRHFMPLDEPGVHRGVADSFRPVVLEFAAACKGNESSPAFTQLRRTLEAAERIAESIAGRKPTSDE